MKYYNKGFKGEIYDSKFLINELKNFNYALLISIDNKGRLKKYIVKVSNFINIINTSLLVLDEIFDSSLDASGVDYFLNLISQLDAQVNVFVISHKGDTLIEKFMSTIKFEKKNDFSTIVNA